MGLSTNWNPVTDVSEPGHTWMIANRGTANVDNGKSYTLNCALHVGQTTGSGTLTLNETGYLSVTGGNTAIGARTNAVSGT